MGQHKNTRATKPDRKKRQKKSRVAWKILLNDALMADLSADCCVRNMERTPCPFRNARSLLPEFSVDVLKQKESSISKYEMHTKETQAVTELIPKEVATNRHEPLFAQETQWLRESRATLDMATKNVSTDRR